MSDKIKIVSIRFDLGTYEKISKLARQDSRPLAQWIRVQLERLIENANKES